MRDFVRAAVVPFFAALFPAVWYVNRNVTTEVLPPRVDPSVELVLASLGLSVAGSAVFGAAVAVVGRRWMERGGADGSDRADPYRKRVLRPDRTALAIFLGFVAFFVVFALVEIVGIGPAWLAAALYVPAGLLAAPFAVLAPLSIRFHWAVVLGLVSSVLWMSLLATIAADYVERGSLPGSWRDPNGA